MAVSRRTVTIVFADVADSTPLGERLDPESLRRVMSRWFERMSEVLQRHGGTVEKFIGDAVMAVFGIPELHEDDALRAVRAATELREALTNLNDELGRELGVHIGIRVGLNTGEVVAGDGTGGQMLVTGDPVNVAKRLEESARTGEILIGENTRRLVANAALLEPREELTVKGKSGPVVAWNVLGVIAGAPAYARRLDAPLVGREEELRRLREIFATVAAERSCQLVTLIGPAGIGKSRLAAELTASIRHEAVTVSGRCLPYGDGITFWPVVQIIGALGAEEGVRQILADAEDRESIAERVLSAVGSTPTLAPGTEMFWAVRRLFEELARERPAVIMFEDIHWAAPTLLDLLEYLAGWTHNARVLLLCLARPDLFEERQGWLSSPNATELVLGPLTDAELEQLLDEIAQEWPLDAAARARIAEAAEGNPLYVEQMAAMLAEGGSVEAIPPTIHALLAARLDRLPSDERAVLERAAVAGKEFGRSSVLQLLDESERPGVDMRLLNLVRKDLLTPRPGREDSYRFRHALIRDAAYAGIPKERRAQLHERFADWAAATNMGRAGELDEIVGYHYEQAVHYRQELGGLDENARALSDRAGALLTQAGERAFARHDMPAAVNLLARATTLLGEQNPIRLQALPQLGSALMKTGDFSRADVVLGEALEGAAAAGDKKLELRTLIEREFFRTFTNPESSTEEIVRIAETTIPLLEDLHDELGLAKAWWLRSEADAIAGRWAARTEALERALVHARRASDPREVSTIIGLLASALAYGPTPVQDAIRRCEELSESVRGDVEVRAGIASTLAALHARLGQFDEARSLAEEARAIYEELGLRYMLAGEHAFASGSIELLAGDPAAAVRELRRGYDALERMGERGTRSTLAAFLAQALVEQGEYEEAIEFSEISEQAGAAADVVTQAVWRSARAAALAQTGDLPTAELLAEEAVSLAEATDFLELQGSTLLELAHVLRLTGDAEAAPPLVERARQAFERKGNVVSAARAAELLGARVR
jgi:class 3 adenylate cyclase/tetratricopeptide (TPR) repeat protein